MKYKGVICFSAIDWNFLKQRVHYIMRGLAKRNMKVLFIENTGVRNPQLKDLSRLGQRFKKASENPEKVSSKPDNIDIFSPLALPFPYFHPAAVYNEKYLSKSIQLFLKQNNLLPQEVVFWTYLATPVVNRLTERFPWGKVVYDLVSDPKLVEPKLESHEQKFLQKANIVFFASYTLYEQYRPRTKNPVIFEDGFNTELLRAKLKPCPLDNLPRPRFLYIGGINRKIWPEMLEALAGSFPGGSVVLVGPRGDDVKIPELPNIYILPGLADYSNLASYLSRADAGIIPYYNDSYSGTMHPAKLNEYLVFGLPVVATATPELEALAAKWGRGFLYLGKDLEGYVRAANSALAEDNICEGRKAFTLNHSWATRVAELLQLIEEMC